MMDMRRQHANTKITPIDYATTSSVPKEKRRALSRLRSRRTMLSRSDSYFDGKVKEQEWKESSVQAVTISKDGISTPPPVFLCSCHVKGSACRKHKSCETKLRSRSRLRRAAIKEAKSARKGKRGKSAVSVMGELHLNNNGYGSDDDDYDCSMECETMSDECLPEEAWGEGDAILPLGGHID